MLLLQVVIPTWGIQERVEGGVRVRESTLYAVRWVDRAGQARRRLFVRPKRARSFAHRQQPYSTAPVTIWRASIAGPWERVTT